MGTALGLHLLDEGQSLVVFNRTKEKAAALGDAGAVITAGAQQLIEQSDVCLLFLSDAQAITAMLNGVDSGCLADKLIVQMGTIAPEESRALARRVRASAGRYLECPVLGSLPEARSGTLILMAGGRESDYQSALPVLRLIGSAPRLIGDIGQGATVKLAMNQLIAGLTASFALSLALVEEEHIDIEQFMEIVRDSALYAPTFDKKRERMLARDFANPNFPTKHLAKDTRLFLAVAEQLGLDTAGLQGVATLLDKTLEMGLADTDYSALMAAISRTHK